MFYLSSYTLSNFTYF